MAASLQKFLKKPFPPPLRFLTTTTTETTPSPFPFLLSDQPHHLSYLNPSDPNSLFHHFHPSQPSTTILNNGYIPNTFFNSGYSGNVSSFNLSSGYVLNNVMEYECVVGNGCVEIQEEVGEEKGVLKCDSVKKKRKKKMNKHKYKKMRKALRKKTG